MLKLLRKLFSKTNTNPYGIDEQKLKDMIKCNLPLGLIKKEFPTIPNEVLLKYIISGKW